MCHHGRAPALLPTVVSSSGVVGETDPGWFGRSIPIGGIAGDQQAATFGQACFEPGSSKNTYGTGAFLLRNIGRAPVISGDGLLTTVLWRLGDDAQASYAREGSVFVAGAAVQWLRDGLRAIDSAADVERLAATGSRADGIYLVPAFTGLGAPWWDPDGTRPAHRHHPGHWSGGHRAGDHRLHRLPGASTSWPAWSADDATPARVCCGWTVAPPGTTSLLQFQADLLGVPVERPVVTETTAAGAAFLAGLAVGVWSGLDEIASTWALDRRFEPQMDGRDRDRLLRGWRRAVERSLGWVGEA